MYKLDMNRVSPSPPGHSIEELIELKEFSDEEAAAKLGISQLDLGRLLVGNYVITDEFASTLAEVFGGTQQFWINREKNYQDRMSRPVDIAYLSAAKFEGMEVMTFEDNCHNFFYETPERAPLDNLAGWVSANTPEVREPVVDLSSGGVVHHPAVIRFTGWLSSEWRPYVSKFACRLAATHVVVIESVTGDSFFDVFAMFLREERLEEKLTPEELREMVEGGQLGMVMAKDLITDGFKVQSVTVLDSGSVSVGLKSVNNKVED